MVQGRKRGEKRKEGREEKGKGRERGEVEKKGGEKRNERAKEEIKGWGEGGKEHRKISYCYSLKRHYLKILWGPATYLT